MQQPADRFCETLLRILGLLMALMAWYPVVFPGTLIRWKGGNRAPLSMQSRIVIAVAMTAWCLAVFGVYPMYGAAVFATCIAVSFFLTRQDRRAHDRLQGIGPIKALPVSGRDVTLVFWFVVALIFTTTGLALIRDLLWLPATDEQHIAHNIGFGLFALSVIGAIVLLLNRRPKNM